MTTTNTHNDSGTLNAKQELFLEYLFEDEACAGSTRMAAIKAGYTPDQHGAIARRLREEILKRTEEALVMNAPKAVRGLTRLMDEDGTTPKSEIRLKAVTDVLDRVGVAKKQDIGVTVTADSPLFFIPAKAQVSVPTETTVPPLEQD